MTVCAHFLVQRTRIIVAAEGGLHAATVGEGILASCKE